MTTGELTDYTVLHMANYNVVLRRNNVGMKGHYTYGIVRWPDVIGYTAKGRFVAIEIKNKDTRDRMRPGQLEAMQDMVLCGCLVGIVTCPADVDKLAQEVRR